MTNKIYLFLLALAITMVSCSDFLEEENRSNVTAETYYTTAEGFEGLVNSNYSQLRDIYGDYAWLFSAGTDLYAEGRTQEPPGLSQYRMLNPSSEGVDHLYNTCYSAIQTANQALYYADLTEQTSTLNTRVAEVQYLRANAYFLLVQTYGGVDLVTENITEPILEFSRNTASEVYDFIIGELGKAIAGLPDGDFNGRVNKRAAQHLLGKVHLSRGYEDFGSAADFTMAASLFDEAINGQPLDIPFGELWAPDNQDNAEILFSVQYSAGSVSNDPFELGNRQFSFFGPYQGGSEVAGDAPFRTYNLCPTNFAIDLFTEDDERWEGTFMFTVYDRYFDYYFVADVSSLDIFHYYAPKWVSSEADQMAFEAANPDATYHPYGTYGAGVVSSDYQTIPVRKFDDPTAPFGEKTSTRDIVLSRLGDTYLLAAEAYLQSGDASTGLDRLNEVRKRAGVADAESSEFDIDYILDERGRELMGEYHRWFDLKRTGKLVERASAHHYLIQESYFDGANGTLKILRPIPQNAIDLNQNRDFQQNPAYVN